MAYFLEHDYYISSTTLALLPALDIRYQTVIHDKRGIFYSEKSMKTLLEEACLRCGSRMGGRLDAARCMLSIRNKIPLIIDPFNHIYAFPTHSSKNRQNSWFFLDHIDQIKPFPDNPKQSKIIFFNGQYMIADCSYSTAKEQFIRTTLLFVQYSIKPPRNNGPKDFFTS
ncbi:competence protein ComK [Jeotgalibacillus proteolyticus]|uniref:competence protein ComK n=1 Tax=Jeotgalibacillus proteolyticus TaxID=2082395 RepID=UPI003CF38F7B